MPGRPRVGPSSFRFCPTAIRTTPSPERSTSLRQQLVEAYSYPTAVLTVTLLGTVYCVVHTI